MGGFPGRGFTVFFERVTQKRLLSESKKFQHPQVFFDSEENTKEIRIALNNGAQGVNIFLSPDSLSGS